MDSDDGSRLFIGNDLVVNHDGLHGADKPMSGQVMLAEGFHRITVEYFEKAGGEGLAVSYEGAGVQKQQISSGLFFVENEGKK